MLITILATIFVLGVLIFFHELGHFLVAKKSGIRVEKFSLGFPPAIISKKWGETVYAIGLIPLGGYVKMAGENPLEETTGEPYEFMSKPIWTRFLVIFAGPFMNFILAVVVLSGLYFFRGKEVDSVFIGDVESGYPAAMAGIEPGDMIVSLDGIAIHSFPHMAEIVSAKEGQSIFVEWSRDGQLFSDTIATYKDYPVTVAGDTIEINRIGVTSKIVFEQLGFFKALLAGLTQSAFYVQKVFEFVYGLISRKVDISGIGGPIIIGKYAGATARAGFDLLMEFLALLSVNLAVLNILPIPVLDGGHLMFLLIERIKGSPLSIKARMLAQQIGMAFLLILIIFVTYNDIANH
jgi:regulator of sigma E protease